MPMMHRYKCLNPNCQKSGRKDDTGLFAAMNAPTPTCPTCGSMKLEDWGECTATRAGWILSKRAGNTDNRVQRIDNKLRGLADQFGLGDISNRDGRAAKHQDTASPGEKGKYGNLSIAGVDVPVNDRPTAAWGKTGYTPFAVKSQARMPGKKHIPTQVVAEHKGKP